MGKARVIPVLLLVLLLAGGCGGKPQPGTEDTDMRQKETAQRETEQKETEQKETIPEAPETEEKQEDVFAAFFPNKPDGSIPDGKTMNELAGRLAGGVPGRLTEVTYTYKDGKISMEILAGIRDIQKRENTEEGEGLEFVYDEGGYYNYLLYLPEGYDPEDREKKWPVIYFFHGIGEKGSDLQELTAYGVPKYILDGGMLEAIMIAPQCPEDSHWADTDVEEERLKLFIGENKGKYRIDEDRIYATGLSMGGRCAWKQMLAMPDTFAAALVVCGRTNTYDFSEILDVPVWMFHGALDDTVAFANVNRIVTQLYGQGHHYFKLTVYPYLSHDSWSSVYVRPDIYEWLLAQTRAETEK